MGQKQNNQTDRFELVRYVSELDSESPATTKSKF